MFRPTPKTLTLHYLEYEPLWTAPDPAIPTRDGYDWAWIQNMRLGDVFYWSARSELCQAVYRKRYLARFWDVAVVVPGPPRATRWCAVSDLCARGIVGLYGWRKRTPHIV